MDASTTFISKNPIMDWFDMKDTLSDLPKTVHGGTAWRMKGVEDYSHNLNPLGPPARLDSIIAKAVSGVDHYPDDSCSELKETLSEHFNIDKECVMIGAGSSELIRAFPHAFLRKGETALIPRPSFAEYAQQCRIAGAEVKDMLLHESHDFRINEKEISDQVSKIKAVYICNPNNPTGRIEPRDKILSIVEECARHDVMVFLDETLLELVPDHDDISCVQCIKDHDNLVIAGSLTKSFAIPGIRIGFGFASKASAAVMDRIRLPWNIGHIEQNVAVELFRNHADHVRKAAAMMRSESGKMYDQLKNIGFPVTSKTDSFFFFNSLRALNIKASTFQDLMLDNKIMVRDCSSFGMPFDWYVRFCVKDKERNGMFVHAVHEALRSAGW